MLELRLLIDLSRLLAGNWRFLDDIYLRYKYSIARSVCRLNDKKNQWIFIYRDWWPFFWQGSRQGGESAGSANDLSTGKA